MITNEQKKLAQWAAEFALKNGCQASRVHTYSGTNSSFEIRDMKIDRLTQASESSMMIQLFVDGRYGAFSTNRLHKEELEKFIRNGIESTRYLAEDKARTLPDPSLYYKGGKADLQLCDPRFDSIQPDDKVALAMKVCDEIMGKDKHIISSTSSYSDETGSS
jgi:PmbA protein